MNGPIIKDAAYFAFWTFVLASGLTVGGILIWIGNDVVALLAEIRDLLRAKP